MRFDENWIGFAENNDGGETSRGEPCDAIVLASENQKPKRLESFFTIDLSADQLDRQKSKITVTQSLL